MFSKKRMAVLALFSACLLNACSFNQQDKPVVGKTPSKTEAPAPEAKVATEPTPDPKSLWQQSMQANDWTGSSLKTALNQGVFDGSPSLLQLSLIENPAFASEKDDAGGSLFHWLVQADLVEKVRGLIAAGLTEGIATPDDSGRIPLHYAKSAQMAALLWDHPALLRHQNNRTYTVPAAAMTDTGLRTPLHQMIQSGFDEAAQYAVARLCRRFISGNLLDAALGNTVNAKDSLGRSPLHYATFSGNLGMIDALSACHSTNMNSADALGRTPLHYAAAVPDFTVGFELLLKIRERGDAQKISLPDKSGNSATQVASKCGNQVALQALVKFNTASSTDLSLESPADTSDFSCAAYAQPDKEQ